MYNLMNVYTLAETCRWTDAKDQLNLLAMCRNHCYAVLSNSLNTTKQVCNCAKDLIISDDITKQSARRIKRVLPTNTI
jgi:hypothetical protein